MIETARQEMIPRLKEIWKDCFHDEDRYIDFFYKVRFQQVETLVNTVNGVPVAMVTLIPGKFVKDETTLNLRYVYAVATAPAYQGRGLASELMDAIKERVGKDYDAVFLVPASKDLFLYYKRFGYKIVCDKRVATFNYEDVIKDTETAGDIQFKKLMATELYEIRKKAFTKLGYVEWDVMALDYIIREYELCEGTVVKVITEEEIGSLFYFYDQEHKVLYIKETSLTLKGLMQVMKKLLMTYNIEYFKVIVSANSQLAVNSIPFVMAYGKGISRLSYANFVKD